MDLNVKALLINQKNNFLKEKKFIIIYLVLFALISLSFFKEINFIQYKFELLLYIVLAILGSLFISNALNQMLNYIKRFLL